MTPDHLRPGSFKEWRAVLAREQAKLSLAGKARLAITLIRAALRIGGVSKKQWEARMKICKTCPIFDPSLFRCRPYDGAPYGCGCFVKWLALIKRPYKKPGCWARNHLPGSGLGWD